MKELSLKNDAINKGELNLTKDEIIKFNEEKKQITNEYCNCLAQKANKNEM
tara:strand:- start:135 stop:287 length:153 start_codon:yes stop_codon:yes gene_type:complete